MGTITSVPTKGLDRKSVKAYGLTKIFFLEVVMKLDHLEKLSCSFGFLKQDSLSGVAALVSEVLTRTRVERAEKHTLSHWQLIFLQSKANGCSYLGEALPHAKWQWPRDTWFQEQLAQRLKALDLAGYQTRN